MVVTTSVIDTTNAIITASISSVVMYMITFRVEVFGIRTPKTGDIGVTSDSILMDVRGSVKRPDADG